MGSSQNVTSNEELDEKNATWSKEIAGRKHVEESLRADKELAQKYLNIAEVIIVALDADARITMLNRKGHKVLGYGEGELICKDWITTCIRPGDCQRVLEVHKRIIAGEPEDFEYFENYVITKNGKERLIAWHNTILKDDNGRIIGTLSSGIDITERKQTEENLQKAKERLDLVQRATNSGAWDWNILTGHIEWTPELFGLFGIDPQKESASFETWNGILHPEDKAIANQRIQEALRDHEGLDIEYRIIKPDGQILWIYTTGRGIYDDLGHPIRMIGFCIDITRRKDLEKNLHESEEKYRIIVESANEGILIARPEGNYYYVNPRMIDMLGYSADEILGKSSLDFTFDDQWAVVCQARKDLNKGKILHGEFKFRRKDGSELWSMYNAVPIFNDQGEHIANLAMHTDITEHKRAEEELQSSHQILESIINTIPVRVFWKNRDLVFLGCNAAFAKDAGFSDPKDVIGKDDYQMVWHDQAELYRTDDIQVIESGRAKLLIEEPQTTPEGKTIVLLTNKMPLRNSDGEVIGVLGTYMDITERKKAEEALRESEEKYKTLIENLDEGIQVIDQEGTIIFSNQRMEEMLGYGRGELVGKNALGMMDDRSREMSMAGIKRDMANGSKTQLEILQFHKNGTLINVSMRGTPIKNSPGETLFLAAISDITERELARKELQRSESRYKSLFLNMLNGFAYCRMIFDQGKPQDFVYLEVNDSFEALTGLKNVIGKKVSEVIPNILEYDPDIVAIYGRVALTGKPETFETYVKSMKMWFSVSVYSPRRDYFVAIFDVITKRKEAESALAAAEEKYRLMVQNLNDVIFTLDSDGRVTYISSAVDNLLGYSVDEVQGQPLSRFVIPEDLPELDASFKRTLSGLIEPSEFRIKDKAGHVHYVRSSSRPIRNDKGPVGVNGIITDITDHKQMEQDLLESRNMLEQKVKERTEELSRKNAEMERFIYTVSHDLRAPLISMAGFLGLVKQDMLKGDMDRFDKDLQIVDDAVAKMDRLLMDTLELSRIGRVINPPETVPFGDMVQAALVQMEGKIKSKEVKVSIAYDLPIVHVDRMRIIEVLVNLIENSLKYMGDQGKSEIKFGLRTQENGEKTLFVQDNGIGIDPSQHDKVFDLFYRVDKNTDGSGVGLAIVKRIIEVHGGRIWIESELGKGCIVCFTLPLENAE